MCTIGIPRWFSSNNRFYTSIDTQSMVVYFNPTLVLFDRATGGRSKTGYNDSLIV